MNRIASFERMTAEAQIAVCVNLDGSGQFDVQTPIGFFNHMLESFSRHGMFDLRVRAAGDLNVDQHHLIEDCGTVIGTAVHRALGEKKGINRAGFFVFPMDDALAVAAVDLAGRPFLQYEATFNRRFCGDLDTDLVEDFFRAFSVSVMGNVVVRMPYGRSDHHKIESVFKAFGKALRMACSKDSRGLECIPSVKGVIDGDRDN